MVLLGILVLCHCQFEATKLFQLERRHPALCVDCEAKRITIGYCEDCIHIEEGNKCSKIIRHPFDIIKEDGDGICWTGSFKISVGPKFGCIHFERK